MSSTGTAPVTANDDPIIEANDVHKTFGTGEAKVEAIRGVTFSVPRGGCTFIIGPSGSGKSTLLYLIGTLDRPTSGVIKVDGEDVTAMTDTQQDRYRRTHMGFIYQSFNLIENLTCLENVLLPYIPTGITHGLRQKATDLLVQVGMGQRLKHKPRQLSGGQQQRVAIVRALINDPVLVLADEPTGNLDRAGGDEIIRILRQRQCTLVIVTHDHRFIAPSDNVLEIEDGRIKNGPGSELTKPSSSP